MACKDTTGKGGETITFPVVKDATYYVIVDGYGNNSGDFLLNCTIKPAYCGNGTVEGNEDCDDGNNTSGDGCTSACKWEPKGEADICPGKKVPLISSSGNLYAFVTGSTTGQTRAYKGTCATTTADAPDQVYQFNSGTGGNVSVKIPLSGTTFNTVLYVREGACSGAAAVEVGCKNASTGNGNEEVKFQAPPNKDYWVFVDGINSTGGNFALEITITPTCGDGILDVGEECDDGNKVGGDGCNASCKVESSCSLSEGEPNPYNNPTVVPSNCKTFRIAGASINPVSDGDHFRINNLPASTKMEAFTYTGTQGTCGGPSLLVMSLWKAPITSSVDNFGVCDKQTGNIACSHTSTDGNCAKLTSTGLSGDYIMKVHGSSTASPVMNYSLVVMTR